MWYNKVVNDITKLPEFIEYYNEQLEEAKSEVKIRGNLEKALSS